MQPCVSSSLIFLIAVLYIQEENRTINTTLEPPRLPDLLIGSLNLLKTFGREINKFIRKPLCDDRVGVKLLNEFFVALLYFLVRALGSAVQHLVILVVILEIARPDAVKHAVRYLKNLLNRPDRFFLCGMQNTVSSCHLKKSIQKRAQNRRLPAVPSDKTGLAKSSSECGEFLASLKIRRANFFSSIGACKARIKRSTTASSSCVTAPSALAILASMDSTHMKAAACWRVLIKRRI